MITRSMSKRQRPVEQPSPKSLPEPALKRTKPDEPTKEWRTYHGRSGARYQVLVPIETDKCGCCQLSDSLGQIKLMCGAARQNIFHRVCVACYANPYLKPECPQCTMSYHFRPEELRYGIVERKDAGKPARCQPCGWQGRLSQLKFHERSCRTKFPCINTHCTYEATPYYLSDHRSICHLEKERCQTCHNGYTRSFLIDHVSTCPAKLHRLNNLGDLVIPHSLFHGLRLLMADLQTRENPRRPRLSYSAERFLDEQAGAIADNLGMMGITPAYTYTHPQDPWVPDDDEIHLPAIEPDSASTIDSLSDSLDLSESLDNG